jgi:phosphate regulon transcriptional regulator PhoB
MRRMPQESILVVEDDKDIAELIAYNLKSAGFQVSIALDGKSSLRFIKEKSPDLIVLDLMLPDMDGIDVCKYLRSNEPSKNIPVVMVTAKGEEIDRVLGFELGADDYIVKPFSPRELVLRIKAILRRLKPPMKEKVIRIEGLTLDVGRHIVTVGDEEVHLTATEFKLLLELMKNRGRVQTREALLNKVWGYTFEGYERTVDTHVRRLRKKLGASSELIETVRGVGYKARET